jgi:alpha-1,3-mannosyltransferase
MVLESPPSSWKSWLVHWYEKLASDPRGDALYLAGLLLGESLLCYAIIAKVPYTEIDWQAYMEEVEGYEHGERDYLLLRGGTGPLVYPAGFLYAFSALRKLTNRGTDIRAAQHAFAALYLLTQLAVWYLYQQAIRAMRLKQSRQHLPPQPPVATSSSSSSNLTASHEIWSWRVATACTCLSKRVHSIFVLRLFNDGPTMLLLYVALMFFASHKWNTGCLVFSLAVSLKMNVLLFAPGLLLLLLQVSEGVPHVICRLLAFCALPQLLLGAPFLLTHPVSYLRKAFELDRVFFHEWTVNWKVRRRLSSIP